MPAPACLRATCPRRVQGPARADRERGSSALELAIVTPVIFLIITFVVQMGLWFHARQVALVVAQEGARVARAETSSQAKAQSDATARSQQYFDKLATQMLVRPRFTPTVNAATGGMRVRADVVGLIPFLTLTVDEVSSGPVERFRSRTEP